VINFDAATPNDTTKDFSGDGHAPAFTSTCLKRERLPQMAIALTALNKDLPERGPDHNVMVVACGEFGRTPRVNDARVNFTNQIGLERDHWPNAITALIAGRRA